jgi:hypothetical protein
VSTSPPKARRRRKRAPIADNNPKPLTYAEVISPETLANYNRLRGYKHIATIRAAFVKQGMSEDRFELFLQSIAALPLYSKHSRASANATATNLARIAKALRDCAIRAKSDPVLRHFLIDLQVDHPNASPAVTHRGLPRFLDRAADQIEALLERLSSQQRSQTYAALRKGQRKRTRAIAETQLIVLSVANIADGLLPRSADGSLGQRRLNKQIEMLAGVLLQTEVRPTLSRLQPRKKYHPRESAR